MQERATQHGQRMVICIVKHASTDQRSLGLKNGNQSLSCNEEALLDKASPKRGRSTHNAQSPYKDHEGHNRWMKPEHIGDMRFLVGVGIERRQRDLSKMAVHLGFSVDEWGTMIRLDGSL